jgi:hypothetical protein
MEESNQVKQYVALLVLSLGLIFTSLGCHFKFSELTTASVGVIGAGLGLLKGSTSTKSAEPS